MLDFFFKHYDGIVDRYVVFDDGSNDQTLDILKKHHKVDLRRAPDLSKSEDRILNSNVFQNNFWKESKEVADWVLVVDVDEHLFHDDLRRYLIDCKRQGVTVVPTVGFEMVGEKYPPVTSRLCDVITYGAPSLLYSKPSIFSPKLIKDMHFSLGRHSASPEGRVVLPKKDEVLLMHYKHVDFDFVLRRHSEFLGRQSAKDLEKGYGFQYTWDAVQLRQAWDNIASRAIDVRQQQKARRAGRSKDHWWKTIEKSGFGQYETRLIRRKGLWGFIQGLINYRSHSI